MKDAASSQHHFSHHSIHSSISLITLTHLRRRRATGGTRVLVLVTTILKVGSGRGNSTGVGNVDAKAQPRQQTFANSIAKQNVVHDGVTRSLLLLEDAVLGIGRQRLGVGSIHALELDRVNEVLVEEHLADVGSLKVDEGAVGEGLSVQVHHDVDVRGAARVVAREERRELNDAVLVSRLDAAQPRVVDVGRVRGSHAVALGRDAAVDTGGVAVFNMLVEANLARNATSQHIKMMLQEDLRQISR